MSIPFYSDIDMHGNKINNCDNIASTIKYLIGTEEEPINYALLDDGTYNISGYYYAYTDSSGLIKYSVTRGILFVYTDELKRAFLLDTSDMMQLKIYNMSTVSSTPDQPANITIDKYLSIKNTDAYTPSDDFNPATKKYVDDEVIYNSFMNTNIYSELPIPIGTWFDKTIFRITQVTTLAR